MVRSLPLCMLVLVATPLLVHAQPAAPTQTPTSGASQPQPGLKIGDTAPPLSIKSWLKGSEVKTFEKGTVYVVEFWATWCGPCIQNIPKLSELQAKMQDKGVKIIGVSTDQDGEAAKKFVETRGAQMAYTVAHDDGRTWQSYAQPFNVTGIPHAFVVDKNGKLAWHGHPADSMDFVLDQVVAGTFDGAKHEASTRRFQELVQKYQQAEIAGKWDDAEAALKEIRTVRPDQAGLADVQMYMLLATGRKDLPKAIEYAKTLANTELKDKFNEMRALADRVVGTPNLPESERAFSIEVAQKAVALGKDKDAMSYTILCEAYKRAGKMEEAIAAMKKASEVSDKPFEKQYFESQAKQMEELLKAPAAPKTDAPPAGDAKPADAPKP